MKLLDLLEITSEHDIVNIIDCNIKKVISRYDGKNSISSSLNEKRVILQFVENNELYIIIDL